MKIVLGWLEEFVGINQAVLTTERLAEVLTDLGLEVEHVYNPEVVFQRFVAGYVTSCEKHPSADSLHVCSVDVGEEMARTIVCGAPNVASGQYVVVALDGATIPNSNITIGKRKLRGIESNGMLCSAAELSIADDADGILVLEGSPTPGTPITTVLDMDVVFDIGVTPNRADCLSHRGVARDVQAYLEVHNIAPVTPRKAFIPASATPAASTTSTPHTLSVTVADPTLAPRYAVQKISNVRVTESPLWMQRRLRDVGLRPRNLVVDVTNYVNMEMGQPLHAFDAAKLQGNAIVVRQAGTTQPFVTLDGKMRELHPSMLMICDATKPIAIAGVMGGANSEIDESTSSIWIESALFDPRSIRQTAKTLGLSTDASYRFERGVDVGSVLSALARATQLITSLGGGIAEECIVEDRPIDTPQTIQLRFDTMRAVNGIDVSNATINTMLTAIGCTLNEVSDTGCVVTPPTWRADITAEIDLAEEVMRLYGVNNIPEVTTAPVQLQGTMLPTSVMVGGVRHGVSYRRELRTMLRSRGYANVVGLVLGSHATEQSLHLRNALGQEYSVLRSSLIPGLLQVAARNLNHGVTPIRLMEIGTAFLKSANSELGVRQSECLGLLLCGNTEEHWDTKQQSLDLYHLLGDIEALSNTQPVTRTPWEHHQRNADDSPSEHAAMRDLFGTNVAILSVGQQVIGVAGQVQAQVAQTYDVPTTTVVAQLSLSALLSTTTKNGVYRAVSPFPTIRRDVAFVVEEHVNTQQLISVVEETGGPSYLGASVFDVFRDEKQLGAGRKSVGIAMRFGAPDRTLVDTDVDTLVASIVTAASKKLGASVRGAV